MDDLEFEPGLLRSGSPAFEAFLRDSANRETASLCAYWQSRRDGTLPPLRASIKPEDFVALLPGIFLMDVIEGDPPDYRFRLFGTELTESFGRNLTGMLLSEVFPKDAIYDSLWLHYQAAASGEVVIRLDHEGVVDDGRHFRVPISVTLLPLRTDAGSERIGQLLGFVHYYREKAERVPS